MNNLKLSRPLVFFDLETTGVDTANDRMIDFGGVKLMPDGSREELYIRVNPGMPIPAGATAVHGIRNTDVKDKPLFGAVQEELLGWLTGCDLAGFNVQRFDIPLLAEEFARHGRRFPEEGTQVVDVMRIFHKKEERSLSGAVRFYCGRELENAHNAVADTAATVDVFEAQLQRYADLGSSVDDLARFCADGQSIDQAGRLKQNAKGDIVFGFGKHFNRRVKDELDYAVWMLGQSFPEDTKRHIRRILEESGRAV